MVAEAPAPITAMHHVALITNDLEATISFYCDLLGGEVVSRATSSRGNARQCFITLGSGTRFEFFEFPDARKPEWTSMFIGDDMPLSNRVLEHIALRVESIDELVAWQQRMEAAGVDVVRPPGRDVIFFS